MDWTGVDLLSLPCAKLIITVGRSWKFPRKSVCWATAKKTGSLRKWLDESVVVARMSHSHAEDLATRDSVRIFRASTDPPQRYTPAFTQIFQAQFGFKILVVQVIQGLEKAARYRYGRTPIAALQHRLCQAAWNHLSLVEEVQIFPQHTKCVSETWTKWKK